METGAAEETRKAQAEERPAPVPERAKAKRKPLPAHLPRQEMVHEPEGDGACTCSACGAGMAKLGEDVTEVLDYVPGRFQVIPHVRPKYACKACDAITQSPAPALPTPRGRTTSATLAHSPGREVLRSPAERLTHRAETVLLLASFFEWAGATVTKLSAKSALAEAFRYTIKRCDALSRFATDARLEIDNNVAENAMRAIALGRKHYLFAGSDAGGERAAAIYTIVQTAKLNGVNPEAYLRDTLVKIAAGHPINRIGELMPWT